MARPTALALAAATLAVAVADAVVGVIGGVPSGGLAVCFLAPAGVGLAIIVRRPANRIAWILLCGALASAIVFLGTPLGALVPALASWGSLVGELWPVVFLTPLALAFLFPDARLASRRWRPFAAIAIVSAAGALLLIALGPTHEAADGRDVPSPLPVHLADHRLAPLFWTCWGGLLGSLLAGAASQRARYRAGSPELRRQILWLAYGALLVPLWLIASSLTQLAFGITLDALLPLIVIAWPAIAVWIAISRHGLYEIDRLVNRTLVYGALTVTLGATYVAVVLLVGRFVHTATAASLATLAAALAFRPARDRLQRAVDRRFSKARFAAVQLLHDFLDDVRDGRAEPEDVGAVLAVALQDPTAEVVFGASPRPGSEIAPGAVLVHSPDVSPDVLRGVLRAAVVPVELARLRVELRLRLAEVESSRARIAQAGYEERRRLERDLHDGAQQRLVALGIKLRRLQRSLPKQAAVLLPAFDDAVGEVAAAISDLRTIAAGVRPPRLDEGLAAALADLARGAGVPVEIDATADRAPPEVEAAAYFVACEALSNAVKHAAPSRVLLRTTRADGHLRLHIRDDGIGGAAASTGSGLPGMRDRVAAQGGRLSIDSPPGAGTTIAVELPCGS